MMRMKRMMMMMMILMISRLSSDAIIIQARWAWLTCYFDVGITKDYYVIDFIIQP